MQTSKNVNVMELMEVKCVQTEDEKIWVVLSSLCDGLGVKTHGQMERIKRDEDLLSKGVRILRIPSNGGEQEANCLELEFMPYFLTGIKSNMCREEVRDNIVVFKLKAKDILAKAFLGENNEKKDDFFNSLGLQNIIEQAIEKANAPLKDELSNIKNEFNIFKQQNETKNEQLYFLVKRFDIYSNESIGYTRIIDDFNAKVYSTINEKNKHLRFWIAISDYVGLDLDKLKAKDNKKKYLLDNVGFKILSYFVDNVLIEKIVQNDKGHWVNKEGFDSDPFGIEKQKILSYWTDKNDVLRDCFTGKKIENPIENVTYDFEHLIPKTKSGTSNEIWNIGVASKSTNKDKNTDDYLCYRDKIKTPKALCDRMDNWIVKYK